MLWHLAAAPGAAAPTVVQSQGGHQGGPGMWQTCCWSTLQGQRSSTCLLLCVIFYVVFIWLKKNVDGLNKRHTICDTGEGVGGLGTGRTCGWLRAGGAHAALLAPQPLASRQIACFCNKSNAIRWVALASDSQELQKPEQIQRANKDPPNAGVCQARRYVPGHVMPHIVNSCYFGESDWPQGAWGPFWCAHRNWAQAVPGDRDPARVGSWPQDSAACLATTVVLTQIDKVKAESPRDDLHLYFLLSFTFQNKTKIQFQRQAA